jgi:WD40 repeat protein
VQRNYVHDAPVNDVVIHPNQGELISCDQAASVKIWDLGENTCTHELARCSLTFSLIVLADGGIGTGRGGGYSERDNGLRWGDACSRE